MNWFWTIAVILVVIWLWPNGSDTAATYGLEPDDYSLKTGILSRECIEPENPYSSYSEGHYAGYEWAADRDPSVCGGNSQSFIEGCEEYQNQSEIYESCLEEYEN